MWTRARARAPPESYYETSQHCASCLFCALLSAVPVKHAADQVQEDALGHVNSAKRQALPLRQTRRFEPTVKFDVPKLHAIRVAGFPETRSRGIPPDGGEESFHLTQIV